MRISQIDASNFLSFDRLVLSELDSRLNVIVGPNGAGKTNLIHLLAMVRDALDPASRRRWDPLAVRPERTTGWTASIALQFSGEMEKQLFTVFFHAALSTRLEIPQEIAEAYEQWTSSLDPAAISGMLSGVLEVTCSHGAAPHWDVVYRFEHEGVGYEWLLYGRTMQGIGRAEQDSDAPLQGGPVLMHLRHGMEPEAMTAALRTFASRSVGAEDILPGPRQIVQVAVRSRPMGPIPQPLNYFGQLTGRPISGSPHEYSGIELFQTLFSRGLAFASGVRLPTQEEYSIDNLSRIPESANIADGSELILYLFLLKNGGAPERARYNLIQRTFSDLTGARFDVGLEPSTSAPEERPSGQVRLFATVGQHDRDFPVAFAGAGLAESLFLSAHIAGSEQRLLCLDEPAINLHPSLQRKVARKLTQRNGQTILITHSPYVFVVHDETDLTRIIRFHMSTGHTQVARLRLEDVPERDRQRWLKEIWRGADSQALLFGRGIVLVEGETEAAALPLWFAKSETAQNNGTPEDNNILIHAVGGAQNLATYSSFLKAFSLPAAIVCDSDQFANPAFLRQTGLEARRSDQPIEQFRAMAESRGIFTLCEGDNQEFECLPYVRPQLERAKDEVGSSPVRQGCYIAETTECPLEVNELYGKLLRYLLPDDKR